MLAGTGVGPSTKKPGASPAGLVSVLESMAGAAVWAGVMFVLVLVWADVSAIGVALAEESSFEVGTVVSTVVFTVGKGTPVASLLSATGGESEAVVGCGMVEAATTGLSAAGSLAALAGEELVGWALLSGVAGMESPSSTSFATLATSSSVTCDLTK